MRKILIIEDEPLAVNKLKSFVKKYNSTYQIIADVDSIEEAVEWLQKNSEPDLLFVDIQLADGLSFEIFKQITVRCPMIFVTAYDHYAIQAFKQNSVDYILKPYEYDEIVVALDKFESNFAAAPQQEKPLIDIAMLEEAMQNLANRYKQRFMVKVGERLLSVETDTIPAFLSEDKYTMLVNAEGKKYIIQYSLEQLKTLLNPSNFYRINRKFIVNIQAIKEIAVFSSNRLKLSLHAFKHDDLIVSRDKVADFKEWLNG